VLSIIEDGDVSLKVWGDEGYGISALRREMHRRGKQISALAVERLRKIGIPSPSGNHEWRSGILHLVRGPELAG
jgi:hypothetical protein